MRPDMLTNDALQQMVEQHYETLEGGHHRLRTDQRSLDRRVEVLEQAQAANSVHFAKIDNTPVAATSLSFTTPVVVAIVTLSLSLAGGLWGIYGKLGSIDTRQETQVELERASTKLNDERYLNTAKTVDTIDKKLELQRLKLESLTETVLKIQPR